MVKQFRTWWMPAVFLLASCGFVKAQSVMQQAPALKPDDPPAATPAGGAFLQSQLDNRNAGMAFQNKDEVLRKEFEKKGLEYPAHYIYIRSFKYDSQLEVWVKNNIADTFRLFKTYHICALSGTLGPKRQAGDRQVPEGFYYISEFRPNSQYHLALGLNYPNFSDRIKGALNRLGDGIYIHGSCATEGCIPLTDPQIEELYVLAVHARDLGQDYIPVHVFPARFDNSRSVDFMTKSDPQNMNAELWKNLKNAYDYFNETHRLPVVMYTGKGDYVVSGE